MDRDHSYTDLRRTQVAPLTLLAVVVLFAALGSARAETYEDKLRDECRALMADAVRKPYGWAWPIDAEEPQRGERRPAGSIVGMRAGESPTAGLVLLLAGDFLKDEEMKSAARQVARGVAAAQTRNGMVLDRPVFATNAGGRDRPTYIPRRDATIAGVAMMLAYLDIAGEDPQIRSAAMRSATWISRQQGQNGGWSVAHPPDSDAEDSIRIMRLDTPDFRDSTFALLLMGEVTDIKTFSLSGRKSADLLGQIRLGAPRRSEGLWSMAVMVDGVQLQSFYGFPDGADLLASRYAIQTLLVSSIVLREPSYVPTIEDAVRAVNAAQNADDETWPRFIEPLVRRRPTIAPTNRPGVTTQPVVELPAPPGEFGLNPVLITAAKLQTTNLEKFEEDLRLYFTPRQHLALAMSGLLDQPMMEGFPTQAEDVQDYAKYRKPEFDLLESPAPIELSARVRRLWWLLVRAKIERTCGA